jgi:hypothetical protein
MSPTESNRGRRRSAFTLATAAGGALAAAMLGMGVAHADITTTYPTDDDGFQILFGAPGNENLDSATGAAQIASNETADNNLAATSPGDETAFTNDAVLFESTGTDHGVEQLVYALDPSSFVTQSTPDIDGYLTGANAGDYLVPDDSLGYLATDLDFFLLSPIGLDPGLLGPLIDTLVGSEVGGF